MRSLSLSVSLGLSLALPPALATVPTVSAERPLLLALGASAARGAARGAGALGAAPGRPKDYSDYSYHVIVIQVLRC